MHIHLDFVFAECLLAYELVGESGTPSKASGITRDEWATSVSDGDKDEDGTNEDDATRGRIMWLLEGRRTTSVQHWSGTLVHPNQSDKQHQTVSAFVHFAYEYSKKSIMFADLQSKY